MNFAENPSFILLLGTIVAFVLIAFIILVVILYRRSQLKILLERQEFKQNILETEKEIQEQTLDNISRDLHDNFGQIASLLKINLNLLSKDLKEADLLRVKESKELLSKLINDIKVLSSSLAAENLAKQGLASRIASDLERVKRTGSIEVDYKTDIHEPELKPEERVFLYRIFQEILNNALKHAHATRFDVSLNQQGIGTELIFTDNGVGIPDEKLRDHDRYLNGNGLLNIRERCKLIGASYNIHSQLNQGTTITISTR